MNILLLVTSSISVKVINKLIISLTDDGNKLRTYYTKNASIMHHHYHQTKVDSPATYEFANEFDTYCWNKSVPHIDDVEWADICLVCPADYNILGKAANGIADDFVSTVIAAWLGSGKPMWMAEAMNPMMYLNKVRIGNREKLESLGVKFIEPTVKKLACGDYGIGGLADVRAVKNIAVDGVRWIQPIAPKGLLGATVTIYLPSSMLAVQRMNGPKTTKIRKNFSFAEYLPKADEPGAFGAKRKYDRHEGVDIYCYYGSEVHAVEDGEVVDAYQYTGTKETGEWWNPTWCIKVKGKSGVVTYGELQMPDECPMVVDFGKDPKVNLSEAKVKFQYPPIGTKIKAGDLIGFVGKVLPDEKRRDDIRNHNNCMLHLELRTESCHLDGWKLDGDRDRKLLDPTPYLKTAVMHEDAAERWQNGYFTAQPKWANE